VGRGQRTVYSVQSNVLAPLLAVGDSGFNSEGDTPWGLTEGLHAQGETSEPLSTTLMQWPKYEGFLRSHYRALEGLLKTLECLRRGQALGISPLQP
jgi:hypothetical protein